MDKQKEIRTNLVHHNVVFQAGGYAVGLEHHHVFAGNPADSGVAPQKMDCV